MAKAPTTGAEQIPLFDVEQKASYGRHPEAGDTPQVHAEFTPHEIIESAITVTARPEHLPRDGYAEPGVSVDVAERAQILHDFIPFLAGIAMRQKLPNAMHTDAATEIEARYGAETGHRVNTASRNAEDMRHGAWNTLHKRLGYVAVGENYPELAPTMRSYTSEDLHRMFDKYGARKGKAREAFQKQLDVYVPRPKKMSKPRKQKP